VSNKKSTKNLSKTLFSVKPFQLPKYESKLTKSPLSFSIQTPPSPNYKEKIFSSYEKYLSMKFLILLVLSFVILGFSAAERSPEGYNPIQWDPNNKQLVR